MKCKQHPNVEAVGNCTSCGAPLCQECFEDIRDVDTGETYHLCHDCAIKYNKRLQRSIIFNIILLVLIVVSFIVGIILITQKLIAPAIIIIIAVGALTNWKAIPYRVVVDGSFSFLRLLIKILISVVISPVSVVFCIINMVKLIKNYKNISKNNQNL